jgi:hypothetical protein
MSPRPGAFVVSTTAGRPVRRSIASASGSSRQARLGANTTRPVGVDEAGGAQPDACTRNQSQLGDQVSDGILGGARIM